MNSMGCSLKKFWVSLLVISVFIPRTLGCFSSIFSFGDSIADTGNLYITAHDKPFHFFFPPYGETFFHNITGRCSDGRLIIDLIAEFLGLPPVPPYFESHNMNQSVQNFEGGVNFAVAGATALDAGFLEAMGDQNPYTNNSLAIQVEWFKQMLPNLCNTSSNCNELLSSSLFLVGEIGGNDYTDALLAGKSIEQVEKYVPLVIEAIASTINELIELGAATILVPGNFPIGCLPIYLENYEGSDKSQYDPSTGCLIWLNEFAECHNEQLQTELSQIRRLHPHVNIIYADYYSAMMHLYHSPEQFGFLGKTTKACCGGGGRYNYNSSAQCGSLKASACENPAEFINWDGIHFTEAAYRWITKALLKGKYTIPHINPSCVSQLHQKKQLYRDRERSHGKVVFSRKLRVDGLRRYAGAIFGDACLKGLNGVPDVVECTFVQSSVTELPFFASKVKLGKNGVDEVLGLGSLSDYEKQGLESLIPELKSSIEKGIKFAKES